MSETMEDDLQAGDDGLYCVGFLNEHLLTDMKIVQRLSRYGQIVSVTSGRRDPQNPGHKPWCFVRFANPEEAVRAMSGLRESPHLCNTKFVKYMQHDGKGRAAGGGGGAAAAGSAAGPSGSGVSPLVRDEEAQQPDKHEVYLGNWPLELDQASIVELFGKFQIKVVDIRLYNKEDHSFAFVVVPSAEDAEHAIKSMNGGKVAGRVIKVGCPRRPPDARDATTSADKSENENTAGGDSSSSNGKGVHQRLGGGEPGDQSRRRQERAPRGGRWQQGRPRGSSADRRHLHERGEPAGPMPPLVLPGPPQPVEARPPPLVLPGPSEPMDARPPPLVLPGRPQPTADSGPPPLVLPAVDRPPGSRPCPPEQAPVGGPRREPYQVVYERPDGPRRVELPPPGARHPGLDFAANGDVDFRQGRGGEALRPNQPDARQLLPGLLEPGLNERHLQEASRTLDERSPRGPPVADRLRAQGPPRGNEFREQPRGEPFRRQQNEDHRLAPRDEEAFRGFQSEEPFRGRPDGPNKRLREQEWPSASPGKDSMYGTARRGVIRDLMEEPYGASREGFLRSGPCEGPSSGHPNEVAFRGRLDDGPFRGRPDDAPFRGRLDDGPFRGPLDDGPFRGRPDDGPFRGQPEDAPFRGRPDDGLVRGRPDDGPFRGQPDDGPFRGRPDDGPFRGRPDDGPFRGRPDDGPFRGGRDDGPFRGPLDDGPFRGRPDDGPFRGHPDDGPVRGRPDDGSIRGRLDEGTFRGRPDQESYRGRPGEEPPRAAFFEGSAVPVGGKGRGLLPIPGNTAEGPGPSQWHNQDIGAEAEPSEGWLPAAKRPRYGEQSERERMPPTGAGAGAPGHQPPLPAAPDRCAPTAGGGRGGAVAERIKSSLRAPTEVVVANFPVGTNERRLMQMFDKYEPLGVRIMVNNSSSHPDDFTYAYLTVASRMAADEAVMDLDGLMFRGRPLVVETKKQ